MNSTDGSLDFKAWIDSQDFNRQLGQMEGNIKGFTNTVQRETSHTSAAVNGVLAGAASAMTFAGAAMFAKQLISVRGEFQKYQAVLTNSLQDSNAAHESMQMLANVAAKTPFQLDKLTEAYIKLVNQGFKPTREEVIKIGDLASSTGKQFDQLVEAILDAQTGQFERLKEFGIKASKEGDRISFTFKGITTTVEDSGAAIRAYMLSLGDMTGVKGSMEAISGTLVGQVSNLEDSITAMFNQIGEASEGFLSAGVSGVSFLVQNYQQVGEVIGLLIATYGTYKAAILTVAAVEKIVASSKTATLYLEMSRAIGVVTVAHRARAAAMAVEEATQAALNKTMLLNPYVAVAAAVVGLGYAIYKMANYTTDAEKAQKELDKTIEETMISIGSERAQIDTMFARLNAAKKGTEEYKAAKDAILGQYGQYLKGLGDETTALNDVAKAYTLITSEAAKAARARGLEAATKQAANVLAQNQADAKEQIRQLLEEKYKGQKDAAGVSLAETYYWKIVPVIDGTEKLSKEVQDIINQFNEVQVVPAGNYGQSAIVQTSNAIMEQIHVAEQAKSIYDKTTKSAQMAFGEAPKKAVEESEKKLGTFKEQVTAAKDAVSRLTDELAALRKGEGDVPDFEKAIKAKEAELKAAQTTLSTLTGTSTKETQKALTEAQNAELAKFKELLDSKKSQYEKYNEWVMLFGKESADRQFSELIAQGDDYAKYIQAKITQFEAQKKLTPVEKEEYQTLKVERPQAIAFVEKQNVENYRSQLAEQAAGFRKVSEQVVFLQEQLDKIDASTSDGVNKKIAAMELLTAAQKKQQEEEKEQYEQLQKDYVSLQQELVNSATQTAAEVALAIGKGNTALAAERQKAGEKRRKELQAQIMEELGLLDLYAGKGDQFVKDKIDATLPLFKDIADLTLAELKKVDDFIGKITFTPEQLAAMKQAGIDVEKLKEALEAAKKEAKEFTNETKWNKVLESANRLSGSLGRLGDALSESEGALGEIGRALSGISGSIDDISVSFDDTSTTTEKISAGINGIIDLYNMVAGQIAENKRRHEEYNAAIAESAHQMALFRIEALAYKEANVFGVESPYAAAIDGAKEYSQAVTEMYAMVTRLEAGQVQAGERQVIDWGNVASGVGSGAAIGAAVGSVVPIIGTAVGAVVGGIIGGLTGLFGGKETEKVFTSLKEQYGEIFDPETFELNPNILADYDLLDDKTKALVDNWEEYKQKAVEAQEQMRESFRELAGDIGGSLSDALVDAFRNGDIYDAVDVFHEKVTSVIEDIVSRLIFAAVFQKYFDKLQADMEASFDPGGDQSIVDDIIAFTSSYQEGLGIYNQAMLDAQDAFRRNGFDIFQRGEDAANSMAGAIRGVTEDTANLIAGQMNAIRINQASSLSVVREQLQVLNAISYNTAYMIKLYDYLTSSPVGSPLAGTGIKTG